MERGPAFYHKTNMERLQFRFRGCPVCGAQNISGSVCPSCVPECLAQIRLQVELKKKKDAKNPVAVLHNAE